MHLPRVSYDLSSLLLSASQNFISTRCIFRFDNIGLNILIVMCLLDMLLILNLTPFLCMRLLIIWCVKNAHVPWKSSGLGALDVDIRDTELKISALELDECERPLDDTHLVELGILYDKLNA